MSQYLYLSLTIGSILIPLLYSIFEKKFHFIQYAKITFISIVLVAIPFLIWDALFTYYGIWGFNTTYHLPITFGGMPVGEWLFFLCIPYACLFTSEVLTYLFPKFKISKGAVILISFIVLVFIAYLLLFNFGKWYTTVNFIIFMALLIVTLAKYPEALQTFYPNFLVLLVPFFIVNGILTGSFISEPVVWYNNNENLGFRLFTVPFEDIFYAFTLLFSSQLIFNHLKRKYHAKKS